MKLLKKCTSLILSLAICLTLTVHITAPVSAATLSIVRAGQAVSYTGKQITKVSYNGSSYSLQDTPALLLDGYVMVPYYQTYVTNGPKLSKSYNSDSGVLTLKDSNTTVKYYVNKTYAYVNGTKKSIGVAPCFVTYKNTDTSVLMIPAKTTSSYFNISYTYDSSVPDITLKKTTNSSTTTNDTDSTAYTRYTTASSLAIRKSASTSSDVVGHYNRNTKVNCYGTSGNFTKVKYNGSYRYCGTSYLNTEKVYYRYINVNSLKIRKTASADAEGVGYYKLGVKVLCYGKTGDYTKIKYDGSYRYLKTSCLTSKAPLQASSFSDMSTSEFIKTIGPIAKKNYKTSGVLASVTIAQAILESGWGKSELAKNANNMFGMKKSLSGNTWSGSVWTGSVYKKKTAEYRSDGSKYYITAEFRKYNGVNSSIADHSAYLLGAKNGSKKRYAGLADTTSYKKQLTIIKNGGYATDPDYVSSLCNIIEKYDLTDYDVK